MTKEILIEYADMKEEIKYIRQRIKKLNKEISMLTVVSDSVKGTKKDGTYGNIKVEGYPTPLFYKKREKLQSLVRLLEEKEIELLDLTTQAEEYIESIEKSELRIMFRLYYIEDLTWVQVAHRMNTMFPKRKYTEDSCWRRNERFFKNVGLCREEKC